MRWRYLIGLGVLVVGLLGCETAANYLLNAVDPCADCYLEPAGKREACLSECRKGDDADPCAPCAELPKGKRAKCFEECEDSDPPDSTGVGW